MKRLIKKVSERSLQAVLDKFKITPNKIIGQHFLTDEAIIKQIVSNIIKESLVIETGAGLGQLTQEITAKAKKVIAIEIDPSFRGILSHIKSKHRNLEVIFADILKTNFNHIAKGELKVQIIASLPFHISEPFLSKISFTNIANAILIVGKSLGDEMTNVKFGRLTILAQTLFHVDTLMTITKDKFFPKPRTDAFLMRLIPRQKHEFKNNLLLFLSRKLLMSSANKPLVKNTLKEGLIEFGNFQNSIAITQNKAKAIIQTANIEQNILNKTFNQLNNNDLKILYDKLPSLRILP